MEISTVVNLPIFRTFGVEEADFIGRRCHRRKVASDHHRHHEHGW
jgi:hypothetical protein